ncbi:DUF2478 domain-containing protein [Tropicimonas sp.]|uniref:DUF2478 domain-containing protein n=1 Tax=Tropicimonas sp. TaxID=2067044 RepID=UPI003A897529
MKIRASNCSAYGVTALKLAYANTDAPGRMNEVFHDLAERLAGEGMRAVGAVQVNISRGPDLPCDMELMLLPDGKRIGISQRLGRAAEGCRLNAGALEQSVMETSRRLADGADLLIVNKFGPHEAEGHGFRELIGNALAEGIPVLVGVSTSHLEDFHQFAQGYGQMVPCETEALHDWLLET